MAIVGSAHVVIRALTDKLQSDIQDGLNKAISASQNSGSNAGSAWSSGFASKMNIPDIGKPQFGKIENDAKRSGAVAGAAIGAGIGGGMAAGAAKGSQAVVAAAGRAGSGAGAIFGKMFNSSGGGGSRVFISMALRIAALLPLLGALVGGISSVVSGLFAMSAAANNAIYAFAPLPGLIAALVQGGSVLMAAFSGVGDAVGAGLKAANVPAQDAAKAMQGLKTTARDAAEAVRDAAEAVRDAREAISDAAEGIRDAREAVRDAARALRETEEAAAEAIVNATEAVAEAKKRRREIVEDAAEAEEEAIEDVADAEEALTKSHKAVQKAQEALTDARKAAQERLLDLQFATRGGAIAEQRAIMALQDARYKLNATAELPADNRLRQEAQLAYDEAQLNLEMTQERNGDTAEALQEIREKGVDGTDEVLAAQERLAEAQETVKDNTEAVTEALERQQEVHRGIGEAIRDANEAVKEAKDALRDAFADAPEMISDAREALRDAKEGVRDAKESLSDAQESLRDALRALADAKRGSADANAAFSAGIPEINAYQDALDNLSPAARTFVEFIVSLRDEMRQLRDAAAAGLFPGLQTAIENLVYGPLFPAVREAMFTTGQSIAQSAISISESLSSGIFVGNFGDVVEGNNRTIERMGLVIGDLVAALFAFMDAAQPVTDIFTKWLVQWADGLRVSTELGNANGTLTDKLLAGADVMKQLIRITKNLWEGFSDLGGIAETSGQSLLDSFEKATERFAAFTDNPEKRQQLKEDFQNIANNVREISTLALALGGAFFRLGADPAIGNIAKKLQPVVKTLEELVTGLLDRVGDDLVLLLDQILVAFDEISKSGAIEVFLQTMSTAIGALIKAFQTPVLGDALRLIVKIGAAMYALSILTKFPGIKLLATMLGGIFRILGGSKLIAIVAGNFKFLGGILLTVAKGALASLGKGLLNIVTKIGPLLLRILPLIGRAFTLMLGPWGLAILGVITVFTLLYRRVDWFREGVQWVMRKVVDAFNWVVDGAQQLWDFLFGNSIFPDLVDAFVAFKDSVAGIFDGIAKFFTETIPNAAQALWNWFSNNWTTIISVIGGPIGLAVALVVKHWGSIKAAFVAVKDWAVDKFASAWGFVEDKLIDPIKKAKDAVGRFFGENGAVRNLFNGIKDWVVDKFAAAWSVVKDKLINPIGDAKDTVGRWFGPDGPVRNFFGGIWDWVRDTFSSSWDKVQGIIEAPISAVKTFLTNFFGEGGTIRTAFKDAKDAIGRIWEGLQSLLATPVNFMINTVYNNGLRKALNLLPGVNLEEATGVTVPEVSRAAGGVLPGWSPGTDVHHFYSPTAGKLNLSGGEAIMRPEFTRAVGGPSGVDRLNKMARYGGNFSFASGGVFRPTRGGTFGPWHEINASDIGIVRGTPVAAVRSGKVVASYDIPGPLATDTYDGDGPYGSYGRVIKIDHGGGQASLYAHLSERLASVGQAVAAGTVIGLSGSTGNSSGPHLHFDTTGMSPFAFQHASTAYGTNAGSPLGPSGDSGSNAGEEEKKNWLERIKSMTSAITGVYDNVKTMGGKGGYYPLMGSAARGVGRDTVQWMNDKIPNSIKIPGPNIPLPDNPIYNPFDRGGIASGESDVWLPKRTASPERVLSPDQTVAFEKLVAWLDKNGAPGSGGDINLAVQVPQEASARDVVEGIVYELRRARMGGKYN